MIGFLADVLQSIATTMTKSTGGREMVYWITGRKGSGKTTLARKLAEQIAYSKVLDGDEFREKYNNQDYTPGGRLLNQLQITDEARELERQGKVPIVACVSPVKEVRQRLQAMFDHCIEIQLPFGTLWEGTTYEE